MEPPGTILYAGRIGLALYPSAIWDVDAWFGQSLNNKPFITVSPDGNVLISDPESGRVLQFTALGDFLQGWTDFAINPDLLSQPNGLAFDLTGSLWVVDTAQNTILRFSSLFPIEMSPTDP